MEGLFANLFAIQSERQQEIRLGLQRFINGIAPCGGETNQQPSENSSNTICQADESHVPGLAIFSCCVNCSCKPATFELRRRLSQCGVDNCFIESYTGNPNFQLIAFGRRFHLAKMIILVLEICLITTVVTEPFSLLSDDQFHQEIESSHPVGIYFYNNAVPKDTQIRENVIKSIRMSRMDLEPHGIRMGIMNCDDSKIRKCREPKNLHHVIIYKNGDVNTAFNGDTFQTLLDVQVNMKHYAGLENVKELMNKEEYMEIQRKYAGKSDLLIFYIPKLGSIEHLRMLNTALKLPEHYRIFYTFNQTIFDDGNSIWLVSCMTAEDGKCEVIVSSPEAENEDLLNAIRQSFFVTVLPSHEDYSLALKNLVNRGHDVLVLIAGARKFSSAVALARKLTLALGGGAHALIVDSVKTKHKEIRSRAEDDKIFALVSQGGTGNPRYVNIGFLESEKLEDIMDDFSYAMSRQDEIWHEMIIEEGGEDETYLDSDPESVQDDPVAFSLHRTRHVRNLYYFDYKTLPRLTDESYEKVINGDDYAVILFTLEFNSRALAVLVTFTEIHKAFKTMGKSPMYRVECYNWPDICQEAQVYTSPRMFFYPTGSTQRIEYMGMWDKVSMKDAIIRYSNPSVIVVHKKEDILPYIPITTRTVLGFFESDKVSEEFSEAAEILRSSYQFISLHGDVGKFVADQYMVEYADKRLVAFEHSFPKHHYGTFTTTNDILDFCQREYAAPELQELTIYSFIEVLRDDKPLFIYFWDKKNENEQTYYADIKDTIQDIALKGIFSDQVLFTWMDSSKRSIGEFVAGRYNYRSRLEEPLVAFFDKKGTVILKSCASDCSNTSLITWLQDCLDGKLEASYYLSTEEWKPRLEGYDFLQMMKDEGTYPMDTSKQDSQNQDDAEKKEEPIGGRRVAAHFPRKKLDSTKAVHEAEMKEKGGKETKSKKLHQEL